VNILNQTRKSMQNNQQDLQLICSTEPERYNYGYNVHRKQCAMIIFLPFRILKEYIKWRRNWDGLCNRCGLCCYIRAVSPDGEVEIDFSLPCDFLNPKTKQCRVYADRFQKCSTCRKVNLFRVLFHPAMPPNCAYVRTFRLWKTRR